MAKQKMTTERIALTSRCECCEDHGNEYELRPWKGRVRLCYRDLRELDRFVDGSAQWVVYRKAVISHDCLLAALYGGMADVNWTTDRKLAAQKLYVAEAGLHKVIQKWLADHAYQPEEVPDAAE